MHQSISILMSLYSVSEEEALKAVLKVMRGNRNEKISFQSGAYKLIEMAKQFTLKDALNNLVC